MRYPATRYPITVEQYYCLRAWNIIDPGTEDLHINKLWRYTKQGIIELTPGQVNFIALVFDSCGYRAQGGEIIRR